MSIFSVNYNLIENVLLAKHTFDKLDNSRKNSVIIKAKEIIVRGGFGPAMYDDLSDIERYSILALGMLELEIPPDIIGAKWNIVGNPFLAAAVPFNKIEKYRLKFIKKYNVDIAL